MSDSTSTILPSNTRFIAPHTHTHIPPVDPTFTPRRRRRRGTGGLDYYSEWSLMTRTWQVRWGLIKQFYLDTTHLPPCGHRDYSLPLQLYRHRPPLSRLGRGWWVGNSRAPTRWRLWKTIFSPLVRKRSKDSQFYT